MPHQAGDGRDPGKEKNGPRREQEAEEPEQDSHAKRPAQSRRAPLIRAHTGCERALSHFCPRRPRNLDGQGTVQKTPQETPQETRIGKVCRRSGFCSN
jgi:hypothetical protein